MAALNVHKYVDSAEALVYLPFALSRLRSLAVFPNTVQQVYTIDDVTCRLLHVPSGNNQFLWLTGGGSLRYEFFTSDAISFEGGYGTPPYVSGYSGSYVCGHSTQVRMGRISKLPDAMSSWTSLGGAEYLNPTVTRDSDAPKWVGRHSYNNQKVAFQQTYVLDAAGIVRYTVTPAAGQHMFAHTTGPTGTSSVAINNALLGGDVGWDVRQPVYQNGKLVSRLQPLLPPPFWWRRGTVILAKDSAGNEHPITVVTDAMSNFYFFRTVLADWYTVGTELYVDRYVPPQNYVKVPASSFLPSWVETPTIDTMRPYAQGAVYFYGYPIATTGFQFGFPTAPPVPYTPQSDAMPGGDGWAGSAVDNTVQVCEYLWEFNADGSQATAIVHENHGHAEYYLPTADENPATPISRPIKVMRWGYVDLWVPSSTETEKASYFASHGGLQDIDVRIRGLVSVNITITVTGEGVVDFAPTVSCVREVKNRHFIDVAYAMKHPKMVARGADAGDLLATEVEIYHTGTTPYDWKGVRYNTLGVHNLSKGTELLRWRMDAFSGTTTHADNVAVLDFGNLAEVTQYGTSTSVSPYGRIPGAYRYDFNAKYHWFGSTPLESYTGLWSEDTLYVADLKALAFITGTQGYSSLASRGLQLFMFGEEVASSGNTTSAKLTDFPPVASMHRMPMNPTRTELAAAGYPSEEPYNFYAAYQQAHALSAPAQATHLLNVHPAGHYAAFAQRWEQGSLLADDPVIDVVAFCSTDGAGNITYNTTTHREMFNTAFKQGRTYGQYRYGAEFGAGMFATAGMWV